MQREKVYWERGGHGFVYDLLMQKRINLIV